MDDLISRQRLLKELKHHKELFCRNRIEFLGLSKNDKARVDEIDNCYAMVINAPSAQPERKNGKWIPQDHNKTTGYATTLVYYYPKCSECGHTGDFSMNFCPNCGADMREETK